VIWPFLTLLPLLAASPGPPSRAALRRTLEQNRPTLVEVVGPKARGPGVVVGARGEILTSVDYVGLEHAEVELGGRRFPAKVLAADGWLKIAIVSVQVDPALPAAAVAVRASLSRGQWLLGLNAASGDFPAAVGQVKRGPTAKRPFVDTDLALPAGSPVFDPAHGHLVAIAVERTGRLSARVLPISHVERALQAALALEGASP
jgi:hypothetical protein